MAERGELGLLPRQRGNDADSGPALAMTASSAGDAAHIVAAGETAEPFAPDRIIEPGRTLALADFAPPSLGAGERLIRLAYRLGVPGGVLRSPFRKAPRSRLLATVSDPLPGQRAAGTALRAGWLTIHGGRLALADLDYASKATAPPFARALHGFRWLDDLAASGPRETGAAIAERLLAGWLDAHPRPGKGPAWVVGNAGQRLLGWLIHAPLILSSHDKAFRARVLRALDDTARWLDRHVGKAQDRLGGPYYTFYTIYLVDHGYSKSMAGWLWALGVICEIGIFVWMPHLYRAFTLRQILLASFACAVLRFLLIGWLIDNFAALLFAQVLHAATFGSFHAAAIGVIHKLFRGRHQARGQALYGSFAFGVGGALGGFASGYAWAGLGATWTFTLSSCAAFAGLLILWWNLRFAGT